MVARAISRLAHAGQTDKAGGPYYRHPERVAERVENRRYGWTTERAKSDAIVVAYLHDVLEDGDFTSEDLEMAGVSLRNIGDVQLLTRKKGQPAEEYYNAILGSGIACTVKLADIADNTDVRRLAKLDDETIVRLVRKYAKALEILGEELSWEKNDD